MNTRTTHPVKAILASLILITATGHSTVISNDAVLRGPIGNRYSLELTQSIQLRGFGLFQIIIQPSQTDPSLFEFNSVGIAELMALYVAPFGTEMNAAFVSTHTPLTGNTLTSPHPGSASIPENSSRYFAYWDGTVPPAVDTDNYGWILISNQAGVLSAESGATAVRSGIIVGTTTQIPEPSSLLLASLAGFGVFTGSRCRRRSAPHRRFDCMALSDGLNP